MEHLSIFFSSTKPPVHFIHRCSGGGGGGYGGSSSFGGGRGGGGGDRMGGLGSDLHTIHWDLSSLPKFEKNFYREHENVRHRSLEQVMPLMFIARLLNYLVLLLRNIAFELQVVTYLDSIGEEQFLLSVPSLRISCSDAFRYALAGVLCFPRLHSKLTSRHVHIRLRSTVVAFR